MKKVDSPSATGTHTHPAVSPEEGDGGHIAYAAQCEPAPLLLQSLRYWHKERQDYMAESIALVNRMRARLYRHASATCQEHKFKCESCRKWASEVLGLSLSAKALKGEVFISPDVVPINAALVTAWLPLEELRKEAEKEMLAIVKQLPAIEWIEKTRGFGTLGFAQIIAEAGDLSMYPNPGKLWKRFGLAVVDGGAQRRVKGDKAFEHGFSPRRRAVIWNIGHSMIMNGDTYKQVYDERKAYEVEKNPEAKPIVHHKRAQRYMEKRLLLNLWAEWRHSQAKVKLIS